MQIILLVSTAAGLSAAMAVAWAVQRRTGLSGWVDTIWSAATGIGALAVVILAEGGEPDRKFAAGALVALWGARLAWHISARNMAGEDDPRYAALMKEWGPAAPGRLFRFLQIQALAAFVLVVSVYATVINPAPFPGILDIAALAVAIAALAGEAVADAQLARFRQANRGRTAVCDTGLWRWSRHPNYFFEWLWWTAWPLMAFSSFAANMTAGLSLLAPVMMYWLLVHVSGIPPLEQHMAASRGAAFKAYQARVNAFFPGPRRAAGEAGAMR